MLNSPRVITNMLTASQCTGQLNKLWCVQNLDEDEERGRPVWGGAVLCPRTQMRHEDCSVRALWRNYPEPTDGPDLPGGPRCGVTRDTERKCNEDGFIIWIQTCLSWDARAGLDQYILLWSLYQTIRLNRIINCSFQNVTILRNHFLNLFLIKSV